MNAPLRQSDRLGRLTTSLGDDTLALLRFDGSDHMNDLYEYQVEALAMRDDLDFDALVGTHATVEIEGREGAQHFGGIVTQARWAGVGENGHRYDLVLRPWFWLAGRRRNQRIFHNRTVVQILREMLADYAQLGDPALDVQLSQDYPVLEYTVQYRESDLNFARRQMERHGISFHFRHQAGSHTLVLTDDVLAHESVGARPYKSYDGHHQAEGEHFWDWTPERNITTGAIRLTDYDFKKPNQAMETDRLGDATHAQGQIESFDYPGDYLAQDVGKIVAGLRTHQERGGDRRNRAVGDCLSLRAGRRLTLSGDKIPGTGESYLCLSASHHFVSEAYGSGGQSSDGYSFTGSYTLMPDTAPMFPPRRTHVPAVQGPQTAVVVGEGEIDCDEYGRILVRFHWDLDAAHSMRCRVSQNWAGTGWGGMVIPRIGMEVLVDFLEGDPDKPIVVGNVFNGKNVVPYELPVRKTISTFRTKSHDGKGTARGFNEMRFEDQVGEEEIRMHAEKDFNQVVKNDRSAVTLRHSIDSVRGNRLTETLGNTFLTSLGGVSISSGVGAITNSTALGFGNFARKVSESAGALSLAYLARIRPGDINLTANLNLVASADEDRHDYAGRNHTRNAGEDVFDNAGRNYHMSVRKNSRRRIFGSDSTTVEQHRTEHVGQIYDLNVGAKAVFRAGSSRIELLPDGRILISGSTVEIKGSELVSIKSPKIELN